MVVLNHLLFNPKGGFFFQKGIIPVVEPFKFENH